MISEGCPHYRPPLFYNPPENLFYLPQTEKLKFNFYCILTVFRFQTLPSIIFRSDIIRRGIQMTARTWMLLSAVLIPAACFGQPTNLYIKAGNLFDGRSVSIRQNMVIGVSGGRITTVAASADVPDDGRVIDLGNYYILPGLIDTHTHIALHDGNYDDQILRETPEYRAIYAVANARKMLLAGITTIRDMGNEGSGFADIALRDAINHGIVPGPRIQASIQPVTASGAYALLGFSPYIDLPDIAFEADGPDEMRKQVRKLIQYGADVIKVYLESFEKKQLRPDILSGALNYTVEELSAIVDEARRGGLRVAAHVYSDSAAWMAVKAGVHSIEHGLYLETRTFQRMAEKGIFYVPTLVVYQLWRDGKILQPVSAKKQEMLTRTVHRHIATFKKALKTKVKIAFGSDTFALPGTNAQELELMAEYGMESIDVLFAATQNAAALMGINQMTGSISPDLAADIIAVSKSPLEDMSTLREPVFVMKDGIIYREP